MTAIAGLTEFLADGGVDGVLACGTTGEGVLLDRTERLAVAEAFVSSAPKGFDGRGARRGTDDRRHDGDRAPCR